ncbi:uncharacterized protein CLUP02_10826 [Colletotrichum lupini]|uniref:Uncharacterized protein n=1 Tax=Colletotrichum lupini TaxID=145971 RepID=A0A9Q8WJ56_9PEZI|nr:uncharacterized protein CLUP02_10826 [Colletotrichum lupini]UQC85329.1 hypothetical protein CLUP02_10826 [Colletotrichum lupini]
MSVQAPYLRPHSNCDSSWLRVPMVSTINNNGHPDGTDEQTTAMVRTKSVKEVHQARDIALSPIAVQPTPSTEAAD